MGDRLTFFDCPGSIEFIHDMHPVLPVCDAAIVVCEADPRKIPALQVILRELEELGMPRILFLNKIDQAERKRARDARNPAAAPRARRCCCDRSRSWEDGVVTGFVDLALERAFVYTKHAPSQVIEIPPADSGREKDARYLHAGEARRSRRRADGAVAQRHRAAKATTCSTIWRGNCARATSCPVLMGSATEGHGVMRLLKALRHEAPAIGRDARSASASRTTGGGRLGHPHRPHRAWRQAVAVAGVARHLRRRRDGDQFARRGGAHRPGSPG